MTQQPLFKPRSDWKPPLVSDLPNWRDAKRIGLDIETRDDQLKTLGPGVRRGGYITGVSFAIEDGPAFYLPVRHEGGCNLDETVVFRYLIDQAATYNGIIVGANLAYDLDFLLEKEVLFPNIKRFRDVLVAAPLLKKYRNAPGLQKVAEELGLAGKEEVKLKEAAKAYGVNAKAEMWRLPANYVGTYAEEDAALPLRVLRRQERQIEKDNLWQIFDLESDLLPICVKMRRRGVRIDQQKLAEVDSFCMQKELDALEKIEAHTGVRIASNDVWKVQALAPALEAVGATLPVLNAKTGRKGLDKAFLSTVGHEVADLIAAARKFNKVRTTFVQTIRDHMIGGRIHCTLRQLPSRRDDGNNGGAVTGRCSCENPNLQQVPKRDEEIGPLFRSIFIPDEGGIWCCADFSSQEPRLVTHYAAITGMSKAALTVAKYQADPRLDNHQMMADLTGLPRSDAKQIYLGLCYGMGGAKLARELGLPTKTIQMKHGAAEVAGEQAQSVLNTFNSRAPFIKQLAKRCQNVAEERGYIITLLGRRGRFDMGKDGGYDWTHKALNTLIQGSAADQTKKAMVDVDRAGFDIQLQVHDELDLTVVSQRQAEEVGRIMENAVELKVPSVVDVETGPSWGEVS